MNSSDEKFEKFSYELWQINWAVHLPHPIDESGERTICPSAAEECLDFVRRNAQILFDLDQQHNAFLHARVSAARQTYYERAGDFLALRERGELVGFFLGTPIDWDSYYIRHLCVLPAARGHGWTDSVISLVLHVLREHGVSMAETDVSPSNLITAHIANKFGFYPTGSHCTTRWGVLVRYVKLLDRESRSVFLNQFCHGIRPQAVIDAHLIDERSSK